MMTLSHTRKMPQLLVVALLLAVTTTMTTNASMIVSESRTRLPMSLSTVISDLEAEGHAQLSTACVLVSRSVTSKQKQAVLDEMMGGADEHLSGALSKAVATAKGLALALPSFSNLEEVVQSTVACQGLVIFIPAAVDLARGEGLMEVLAPAMERLLQWQASERDKAETFENKACLVVVCEPGQQETTQQQLEKAAAPILETLDVGKKTTGSSKTTSNSNSHSSMQQLTDVFGGSVLYLTPDQIEGVVLDHEKRPHQMVTPEDAMTRVANVVAEDGALFAPLTALTTMSTTQHINQRPRELAAARQLEPARRKALSDALELVQEATAANTKLVPAFGALCDAVLQQAKEQFQGDSSLVKSTFVGKDLTAALQKGLASEWMDAYEAQLSLLADASFASFRESLGKLRIGPTLANDLESKVQETLTQFAKASKALLPSRVPSTHKLWKSRAADTQLALKRKLRDFCKDRLQVAEASGQFRPIPRKGVTIGMHWLLPKPFGNDYRQEPWMVHATDNLVYVPRRETKVTDVPGDDVKTGDWRDKIVPSPPGRDMVFMQ